MLDTEDGREEPSCLVEAENSWQLFRLLGASDAYHHSFAVEGGFVEELQGGDGLVVDAPGDLFLLDKVEQVGTDFFSTEGSRRSAEIASETSGSHDVGFDRPGGEVTEFHVLDHSLAQRCNDALLC